ncbi:hypothetical protein [Streptomyces sp. NPDC101178]|uniref:hypothetical protein n=1 Tax=Streptomyces sp. NPDC101178 TaxID=3366124 RepID=UPI0037FA58FA
MKRLVVVEAGTFPEVLHARCLTSSLSVRLYPSNSAPGSSVIDEHLVVDVDTCRSGPLLDCADVLQGSRVHSPLSALDRLAGIVSSHSAFGLAAVPLADAGDVQGWIMTDGTGRSPVLVPYETRQPSQVSVAQSLLPSCVHAWLVAGGSLGDWPYACGAPSG